MVWPLPKVLLPVLLNGLVGLVPAFIVPGVLELPEELEPVMPLEDGVVLEEDAAPPSGFDVSPGVPPRTLLPAVVDMPPFWIGWPNSPIAFTCASPKWMIFQSSLPVIGST